MREEIAIATGHLLLAFRTKYLQLRPSDPYRVHLESARFKGCAVVPIADVIEAQFSSALS